MKKIICRFLIFSLFAGIFTQTNHTINAREKLSGTCGENATWEYSHKTKTLTISGTGAITSDEWSDEAWFNYYENPEIQKLVIEEGITSIHKYMFNAGPMTEVSLPSTLTEIGHAAFSDCYDINKINIPKSVKKIGSQAFYACYSLKRLLIPEGVETIGKNAFKYCRDLTYLKLPKSLQSDADTLGISSNRSLRKIVNHTKYCIKVKDYRKHITWKVDGRAVKKIKAGKTATSTGKKYKISYQLNGAKLKGKKKSSYRYGDVVSIDATATKKNGYFFWWETVKRLDSFFLGDYNATEDLPATGNTTLKPCFFYCKKKQTSKKSVTLTLDASEIAGEGDSIIIRYYTKNKLATSKWKSFHIVAANKNRTKGTIKIHHLKKGKRYYFDVQIRSSDSDWEDDIDEDVKKNDGWTSLGSLKLK